MAGESPPLSIAAHSSAGEGGQVPLILSIPATLSTGTLAG